MKKVFSMFVVMMICAASVSFADGHSKCQYSAEKQEKYIDKKMKKMTKAFDLDATQQAEVESALRVKMDKKKAAKHKMKEEMAGISSEFKTKMDGILTAEQKPAFDKMVKKYEEKKHKKRKKFLFF